MARQTIVFVAIIVIAVVGFVSAQSPAKSPSASLSTPPKSSPTVAKIPTAPSEASATSPVSSNNEESPVSSPTDSSSSSGDGTATPPIPEGGYYLGPAVSVDFDSLLAPESEPSQEDEEVNAKGDACTLKVSAVLGVAAVASFFF